MLACIDRQPQIKIQGTVQGQNIFSGLYSYTLFLQLIKEIAYNGTCFEVIFRNFKKDPKIGHSHMVTHLTITTIYDCNSELNYIGKSFILHIIHTQVDYFSAVHFQLSGNILLLLTLGAPIKLKFYFKIK